MHALQKRQPQPQPSPFSPATIAARLRAIGSLDPSIPPAVYSDDPNTAALALSALQRRWGVMAP